MGAHIRSHDKCVNVHMAVLTMCMLTKFRVGGALLVICEQVHSVGHSALVWSMVPERIHLSS